MWHDWRPLSYFIKRMAIKPEGGVLSPTGHKSCESNNGGCVNLELGHWNKNQVDNFFSSQFSDRERSVLDEETLLGRVGRSPLSSYELCSALL